jgi:hypothetical protein
VSRDLQRKFVADLRNKKNASIELSSWRVPLPTVEIDGASLIPIIFLSPVNPPRERSFFLPAESDPLVFTSETKPSPDVIVVEQRWPEVDRCKNGRVGVCVRDDPIDVAIITLTHMKKGEHCPMPDRASRVSDFRYTATGLNFLFLVVRR